MLDTQLYIYIYSTNAVFLSIVKLEQKQKDILCNDRRRQNWGLKKSQKIEIKILIYIYIHI